MGFPTNIFAPASTPAQSIFDLSVFVLEVTAAIFVVVFSLLAYAVVKYRKRPATDGREPAQVYGSSQLELAWTVIPVLIVVILFLAAARVIASIQNAAHPSSALEVTVIGHQFWWEYRYPALKVVTANELHIPVSDPGTSHAHLSYVAFRGYRSQLLGAAPGRQNGSHTESPQQHVAGPA